MQGWSKKARGEGGLTDLVTSPPSWRFHAAWGVMWGVEKLPSMLPGVPQDVLALLPVSSTPY